VRTLAGAMADRASLSRAVLTLLGLIVLVDGVFVGIYYAAGLAHATPGVTLGYTALWTLATLVVVIRGLGRVRGERPHSRRANR
jgi:hypothetical protein